LSQGEQKKQSVYFKNWKELMVILADSKICINQINPIHDQLGEAVFEKKSSLLGFQKNTNVIIYSHVTAYARVKLAQDMLHLQSKGCRIFYCDTGDRNELIYKVV